MAQVIVYVAKNGRCPFEAWMSKLPTYVKVKIYRAIERVSLGGGTSKYLKGKKILERIWRIDIKILMSC